ncbi:MAG: hypothetical protein UY41_C0011G0015 [Candidatus Moranbacteria bacterium GW2011_GWE1_49_15]|nr:MAG: hypothetical protein UX75_C0030G0015 [Candidatus Moranbacteria bacterium GW2011_GWE2_47_10]KKW06958.1 MAG: hypothetical protein UY41_C0011G0015 [Candidatus Moranbacteria bacterium GW2011_GWE1_49_15]HBP01398.1 four helix bundle protein [Candidatus Moranbacteria bacterium]
MNDKTKNYDLEERTSVFSENIIDLCRSIEKNIITRPIINQLMRSGTSVGANYCEANNACSRKDFKNKIFICKKESQETKYWLRLLKKSSLIKESEIGNLIQECQEFIFIFQKIINSLNKVQ